MGERNKALVEFLAAYFFWNAYSFVYPLLGRWSVNWNDVLLKLPGTSREFVLSLLLWTEAHPLVYHLMDAVYRLGFTGVMVFTFTYLLLTSPRESRLLARAYALSFLALAVIFAVVNVNAPHNIYQNLPREYSPPSWQARPQFVLPSPHCTIATVSFLFLFRRRERTARFLSIFPLMVPPATVLLGEHWVWDAVTGIALGTIIWFWLAKRVKTQGGTDIGEGNAH